jgi:hypothetical protein
MIWSPALLQNLHNPPGFATAHVSVAKPSSDGKAEHK